MNDWAWTGTFGVQLANVWPNVLSTVLRASHRSARRQRQKKCKTAVGNVTTTLFVHCTKEIHLTIRWHFKRKNSFDREWIVTLTLNRGFHVRSRCLNVSGTLDFFWSTFCCCDDWLGCFWARKSQNIRVLWWEIQNKENLRHELLQKEQTCIAPIGRMFENRQVVWTWNESPKTTFVHNDTIYASSQRKSWSLVLSHGENNLLYYNVVNVHI